MYLFELTDVTWELTEMCACKISKTRYQKYTSDEKLVNSNGISVAAV